MKVLIGVDDSQGSRRAVDTAFQYFGSDAEYLVVSAGERFPFYAASFASGMVESAAQIKKQLDAAEEEGKSGEAPDVRVDLDTSFGVGHAGKDLCRIAADHDIEVVVIGSHDKSLWERLFHPSVGRYLIDHAPCPVVVVRVREPSVSHS